MCLYDLQYPVIFKSLEEYVGMPTSNDLVCGQDDKLRTLFAKDVDESHGNSQD